LVARSAPVVVSTAVQRDVPVNVEQSRDKFGVPPDAIARAIAFAIEQPAEIDVNEVIVRPAAQA